MQMIVMCSRRYRFEEDTFCLGNEVFNFMHHSSLQHLRQRSSAHTDVVWTCSSGLGKTPCCQNSFVILHRCLKLVEHAWRHGHILDLFASSSSLGFCLIRLQNHTDISECTDIKISRREKQRCRFPYRGAISITLQHQRCVYTNVFLKGSGPPRYTGTGRVINSCFLMVPGSFSGLSFKLCNGKFNNTVFLIRFNLIFLLED